MAVIDTEGDSETVLEGLTVCVCVCVSVALAVGLAVADRVCVGVAVCVCVVLRVADADGVIDLVGVGDGGNVSRAISDTPEYSILTSEFHFIYIDCPLPVIAAKPECDPDCWNNRGAVSESPS